MFSGIIDHCGKIMAIIPKADSLSLKISTQFSHFNLGESIAVDGVCLTVNGQEGSTFSCDLSAETLALTHLQQVQLNQTVNLERALAIGDRLGGHFVTGHVDQVAHIKSIALQEHYKIIHIGGIKAPYIPYLIQKGSITVNGVSLTLNSITEDGFSVTLIPHTLERTNLNELVEGSLVNLEYDYLAKIISQQISLIANNKG